MQEEKCVFYRKMCVRKVKHKNRKAKSSEFVEKAGKAHGLTAKRFPYYADKCARVMRKT
jgi:hypothetical protein